MVLHSRGISHKSDYWDFSQILCTHIVRPDLVAMKLSMAALANRRKIELAHPNYEHGEKEMCAIFPLYSPTTRYLSCVPCARRRSKYENIIHQQHEPKNLVGKFFLALVYGRSNLPWYDYISGTYIMIKYKNNKSKNS